MPGAINRYSVGLGCALRGIQGFSRVRWHLVVADHSGSWSDTQALLSGGSEETLG